MIKNEESGECEKWPECADCELVLGGYVKEPKPRQWLYYTEDEEVMECHRKLMLHVKGECNSRFCIFCDIESIPL